MSLPIIATLVAVVFWIINSVLSKKIAADTGSILGPTVVASAGIVPMVISLFIAGPSSIPILSIALASLAGAFAALGMVLAYKTLMTEQLTNSIALSEVTPPMLVILGIFVLGEVLTTAQLVSIIIIFIGTALIITTEKLKINRRLIPALLSSVCWAIYWVTLSYITPLSGSFAQPVLISRIVASACLIAYLAVNMRRVSEKTRAYGKAPRAQKALLLIILFMVIAGLTDGSGDAIFAFVVGANAVAIGGALSAIQPMLVSGISFIVYKDRLTRPQLLGLLVMVVGAVALSVL